MGRTVRVTNSPGTNSPQTTFSSTYLLKTIIEGRI